ncbi:hypothetical protein BABINDRAFT_162168 [Babjeviella inositovora NRRL Y-12698]|uniref:Cell division control protein n=1 Tax=Babjeviella inositovora NRRL Y-12698 TaxID=984486 RepID=A0A1E3QPV3_9ASCO|nr:uncharacterized protein BABINDRAFT_162168 [Babjeviella inositovora NRRL Y-12698]ODQ79102.1 hypothetical protein BABINDRAFT_162168 [Babjeviella inositovora NRRL Y-12698]
MKRSASIQSPDVNERKRTRSSARLAHSPVEVLSDLSDDEIPEKKKHTVVKSQTTVLQKISLNALQTPPSTPTKARVLDFQNESPVKSKTVVQLRSPPATPQKPSLERISIYTRAKSLFQRGSAAGPAETPCLPSRDHEGRYLNDFVKYNIIHNYSNTVYLYGPPGTGKTALVNQTLASLLKGLKSANVFSTKNQIQTVTITNDMDESSAAVVRKVIVIKINCFIINKPENIFHEIYCQLNNGYKLDGRKYRYEDLQELLQSEPKFQNLSIILVLDELDSLITKDQQIIFQLFKMASSVVDAAPSVRPNVILISIANALDLTDRLLPRLKTNGLSPKTLQFMPYNSDQIKNIITEKLRSLHTGDEVSVPLIHPVAIQLCAKKSASNTGDLRKAFDVVQQSLDLVEEECKKTGDVFALTAATAPKVSISHMSRIFVSVTGNSKASQQLACLNILQKSILASMINSIKQSNKGLLTNNQFYDHYCAQVGSDRMLVKLKKGDFLEIVSALEASSIILMVDDVKRNVEFGQRKFKLNVDFDEAVKHMEEISLCKRFL